MKDEEAEDEVAHFAAQWGLDEGMRDLVSELSPDIRARVLSGFRPNGDTRNVNARLRAFIKSVNTAAGGCGNTSFGDHQAVDDPVFTFCRHWGLPEESAEMLQELTPELQARVLLEFRPNGDTLNPAGRLRAFVRSVVATASHEVDPALQFCQHWGLAEDSLQMLRGLQPDTLQRVLTGFTPNAHTNNVGGRLRAFVRSVLTSSQEAHGAAPVVVPPPAHVSPDIDEFLQRWGLGADSASLLEALPVEILPVVLASFTPNGDTRNMAGRLAAFARSVMSRRGGAAFGVMLPPEPTSNGLLAQPEQTARPPEAFPELLPDDALQEPEEDLVGFTLRWGLGEESFTFLRDLPQDVRSCVIEGFSPNEDTKNPEARLRAFARRIMDRTAVTAPPPLVQDPVLHFAQTWGLDSSTIQFLQTLQPEVLAKVLTDFTPDGTTMNLAARLRGFARGVAQRAASNDVPVTAPPALAPPCAAAVSSFAPPVAIRLHLDSFATHWGLGPASVAMLGAQPHEVIETVLTDFQPPRDTVNIDGRLQGFIRSVAAARRPAPAAVPPASSLPPLKRPRS